MHLRKGIPVHLEIVNSYIRGMDWQEGDVVIWADMLPNRSHGCILPLIFSHLSVVGAVC